MAPFVSFAAILSSAFVAPSHPRPACGSSNQLHEHVAGRWALWGAVGSPSVRNPMTAFNTQRYLGGDLSRRMKHRPLGAATLQQEEDSESPSSTSTSTVGSNPRTPLVDLARLLGATPSDLLYLDTNGDDVRGAFVSRPVETGEIILRLPLTSCIRDSCAPSWFAVQNSDWAARLAASMLDIRLHGTSPFPTEVGKGLSLWLSMLPEEHLLRASLPVHWSEETLANAKCTALEVAADSSYFSREEAVSDIVSQLQELDGLFEGDDLKALAHAALDVVQTRSCQLESADGAQWGPPLHVVAPIFDFFNHASSVESGDGYANASFQLEGDWLVVRARQPINQSEEVLLDYGVHARPQWNCLNHYGFVPASRDIDEDGQYNEEEEEGNDEDVAEVFIAGSRFEVGPSFVPVEMVEASVIAIAEEQGSITDQTWSDSTRSIAFDDFGDASLLTPDVAIPIANRLSEVAFQLILEPGVEETRGGYDEAEDVSASEVVAAKLAANLRWSQFNVLLSCAAAMRDYAVDDFE